MSRSKVWSAYWFEWVVYSWEIASLIFWKQSITKPKFETSLVNWFVDLFYRYCCTFYSRFNLSQSNFEIHPWRKANSIAKEAAPNKNADSTPPQAACSIMFQSKYPRGGPPSIVFHWGFWKQYFEIYPFKSRKDFIHNKQRSNGRKKKENQRSCMVSRYLLSLQ